MLIDEIKELTSSVRFLADLKLFPTLIHGAGPQLNAELEKRGVVSDYDHGLRITTPTILKVAREVWPAAPLLGWVTKLFTLTCHGAGRYSSAPTLT